MEQRGGSEDACPRRTSDLQRVSVSLDEAEPLVKIAPQQVARMYLPCYETTHTTEPRI